MSDYDRTFLDAEEKVNELVHLLEKLKEETISYKSASDQLDSARDNLGSLCEQIEGIASKTSDAVDVIRGIGGPEIMERIQQASEETQALMGDSLEKSLRIESGLAQHGKGIDSLDRDLHSLAVDLESLKQQTQRLFVPLYVAIGLAGVSTLVILYGSLW